ncbi:PHP domain-containing protein [Brachybacterium sp. EF45031]|uniref:PHP domain-containing protein n=1 Tax=Brachybacterium sillae TaxID=2810536 RepID=UPI00217DFA7A|nr:PHP domain-containing protein [Brachybacterium sillae]MCS6712445.1 PHP domain-containing protein [Brachybacterium sillae]
MRVDLHTHSSWSDGTDPVEGLLMRAREEGVDVVGLTDHDTTAGWADAARAVERTGVRVVPGIEVTTLGPRHSLHVLALLVDPSPDTPLAQMLSGSRSSRDTRARRMVERLAVDFPITWDDVQAQRATHDTTVGRPHIADALVAAGVVPSRDAAFAGPLAAGGPYYVPHAAPRAADAVRAITAAGGVAVLAHPSARSTTGLAEELVEELVEAGLAGLEVDHREHDDATRVQLRRLSRRHGLLVTGGSDYHGSGKINRLGENLTQPDVLEAIVSRSTSGTEVLTP